MLNARATGFYAILAGAVLAAGSSAAQGAMTFSIAADNSSQQTIFAGSPPTTSTIPVGPLYTSGGSPSVVTSGTTTTFNFNTVLSPAFAAQADGFVVLKQTTDGHLVMDLHFDSPVSLTATVNEGGVYNETAPGFVQVSGGEVAVEAVNPSATETHAASLSTVLEPAGGWTGTATTAAFTGFFTDYQLLIDNDLIATAPGGGSAAIFKKTFSIDITTVGSGAPPIPEPASLGLLGMGAVGLLMRRRRR